MTELTPVFYILRAIGAAEDDPVWCLYKETDEVTRVACFDTVDQAMAQMHAIGGKINGIQRTST